MAFIYALSDPASPMIPRYIGRTSQDPNRSLFGHFLEAYDNQKKLLSKWLLSLWSTRRIPHLMVYEIVPESDATQREMFWIRLFRKSGWLLNISDGPGGGKGRRPSESNIQKTIERNKRGWSEATRNKQISARTGKKLTPEQLRRRKNSPAVQAHLKKLVERNKSPEQRLAVSRLKKGVKLKPLTPDQLADRNASPYVKAARMALIERNKKGWSETTRQKQIAIKSGRTLTAEALQKRRSSPRVEASRLALIERNKTRFI